jgi:hypothetical protein
MYLHVNMHVYVRACVCVLFKVDCNTFLVSLLSVCSIMQGVNFLGASHEYVISGSDCGHIFVWRKKDGALLRVMKVGL